MQKNIFHFSHRNILTLTVEQYLEVRSKKSSKGVKKIRKKLNLFDELEDDVEVDEIGEHNILMNEIDKESIRMEFYYYNELAQGKEISWERWFDEWEDNKHIFEDVEVEEKCGVKFVKVS